ncbi:hypothetical protein ASG89_07735 [Paenibacillus sp. Soil766]|uniref:hypothetical protein n=1 Tax=Paenibacillus sp. Soil766 TaxID=1736404 RepID=UPI00070AC806|nr:hypothetical protein [Paenibacillus sp. Soil766]KRE93372.1 hypothetical protein ASG89_07735 [Paenibacillus sp. Soil766]
MKKMLVVVLMVGSILVQPVQIDAEVPMPCSAVLESVLADHVNAKGAALVYKVKLTPSFPRTSVSIHANHLPAPSTAGEYDGYEGFTFIPNEISWRFKLFPTPGEGSPTWTGRIDDITADLTNSTVEVRLSNSNTGKLGPVILRNTMNACK